jgi:hypothetical protein
VRFYAIAASDAIGRRRVIKKSARLEAENIRQWASSPVRAILGSAALVVLCADLAKTLGAGGGHGGGG